MSIEITEYLPYHLSEILSPKQKLLLGQNIQTEYDFKQSYLLIGESGLSKSISALTVLLAYCKAVYPNGYDVKDYKLAPDFVNGAKFVEECKNYLSFDEEKKYNAKCRLRYIITAPFLVFDDLLELTELSAREIGEIKRQMFLLTEYRYEQILPTFFTSNLSLDEIKTQYGARTFDRIRGIVGDNIIVLKGESMRGK